MYLHSTDYHFRYADADFQDVVRPASLLAVMQESACHSADELGFGYADLKPRGYGFIIVNSYCEFRRPVMLGERVTMQTWPLPPRHVFFERHYRALVEEEEVAAIASRWCLVDLQNFSLLPPEAMGEANASCPYRAVKSVQPPTWKIPHVKDGREVYRMRVGVSHCDHYLHANNTKYADFFFDCFTMDELRARQIRAFQITYGKQAKPGCELSLVREEVQDGAVCEVRCNGETLTQFRVWFA